MSIFDPRRSNTRLLYAIAVGVIAWFATTGLELTWLTRSLVAGNLGGLTLLGLVVWIIVTTKSAECRRRAAAEDTGRRRVWLIVLVFSTFALFTATYVMSRARSLPQGESTFVVALSIATAINSWLLTHTAFTLRYAHLFYRGGLDDEGGISFPVDPDDKAKDPDDLDFAYFAFTIGMTFQVSDTEISDRSIRHTVLGHAMLSFAFNTIIIALALNVLASHVA